MDLMTLKTSWGAEMPRLRPEQRWRFRKFSLLAEER